VVLVSDSLMNLSAAEQLTPLVEIALTGSLSFLAPVGTGISIVTAMLGQLRGAALRPVYTRYPRMAGASDAATP